MNPLKRRLLLLLAVLLHPVAAGQANHPAGRPEAASVPALETLEGPALEVAFMSRMIAHHEAAIEMAASIGKLSRNVAVVAAAADIVRDQRFEIRQLTAWLAAWHGTAPDAGHMERMRSHMRPMLERFRLALGRAGGADEAFVDAMIPHHLEGIAMARLALARGVRPELAVFARNLIIKQTIEVNQLGRLVTIGM